jgi:hypothetical protein
MTRRLYSAAVLVDFLGCNFRHQPQLTQWLMGKCEWQSTAWLNVLLLFVLSVFHVGLATLMVYYGERLLRRIGRLRYDAQ